jgi:hypothetical protein
MGYVVSPDIISWNVGNIDTEAIAASVFGPSHHSHYIHFAAIRGLIHSFTFSPVVGQ